MPNWTSIAAYAKDMDKVTRDLDIEGRRKITHAQGEQAEKIAARAAMRDLGSDRAFRGWTRAQRIPLDTQLKDGRGGATILIPTRRSAGPWTVAEFGRNQGTAGGGNLYFGPGINRRTGITSRTKSGGLRRVRSVRGRRWNGTTVGKNTASEAQRIMDVELPRVADKAFGVVLRKHFDVT